MKLNFLHRFIQLSLLAASGILPIANEGLYAHVDQVGPVPVTKVTPVVSFPANTNLIPGSIALGGERDLYVGFPLLNSIRHFNQTGQFLRSYELPIDSDNAVAGIIVKWNEDVYVVVDGYNASNNNGNGIWKISHKGHISKFADLPRGGSPSSLVFDKSDHMYVTDSIRGEIYKIDREGNVRSWFRHEVLEGISNGYITPGTPQGVSGITMGKKSKHIYVANRDYGKIFKIKIKQDGSAGTCKVIAHSAYLEGITDLSLNRRGILYGIVPNMNAIVGITHKRIELVYTGSPLDFPTGLIMQKHKGINCGFIINSSADNPAILRIKVKCDPLHAD